MSVRDVRGAGEFVVTLYRNDYADGSSVTGAGVFRLDGEGKIEEVRTFDPPS